MLLAMLNTLHNGDILSNTSHVCVLLELFDP